MLRARDRYLMVRMPGAFVGLCCMMFCIFLRCRVLEPPSHESVKRVCELRLTWRGFCDLSGVLLFHRRKKFRGLYILTIEEESMGESLSKTKGRSVSISVSTGKLVQV